MLVVTSILFLILCWVPQKASLTFLYVGQGDCSVFITGKKEAVIFDSGSTSRSSVGKYVLSTSLKNEGIRLADIVTVSHTDEDHINGIIEILENMDYYRNDFDYAMRYSGNIGIKKLVLPKIKEKSEAYKILEDLAKQKNVKVIYMEAGDEIVLRDRSVNIRCLYPANAVRSENETSLGFMAW